MKKIMLLIMLIVLSSFVSAWYPSVAYYTFDEGYSNNALDGWGNGLTNTTSRIYDLDYVVGNASLNITDTTSGGGVLPAYNTSASTNNISLIRAIDFWYKPIATGGGMDGIIAFGDVSGIENTFFLYDGNADGSVDVWFRIGDANKGAGVTTKGCTLNQWCHIVFNVGDAQQELWIDNVLEWNNSDTTSFPAGWDDIGIGGFYTTDTQYNMEHALIDNVFLSTVRYTADNVTASYNGGSGLDFVTPAGSSAVGEVIVGLQSPPNGSINNSVSMNFTYNVSATNSSLANCSIYFNGILNSTDLTPTNNSDNYFQNIPLNDGDYNWSVSCFDVEEHSYNTTNWTLTIDTTSPIITPIGSLLNNLTIVWNGTLNTWINFSDDREIYSINVTYGNGSVYYNVTNFGGVFYNLSISDTIYEVGGLNLTARVCDSHTAELISSVDTKTEDSGIKYIISKKYWLFTDDYIKIYPKDNIVYDVAKTIKLKDRYTFTFNKKIKPLVSETFIVESNQYIDIAKMQNYKGHLIVPGLNYWVDFENKDVTKVEIKRISDTKVEVILFGLKDSKMTFNSIGELNCVEETYYFSNLNPLTSYSEPVLVGANNTFILNISRDDITMTNINATLFYNNTEYFVGTDNDNFTVTVTAPISAGNNPFYWFVNVDGVDFNLSEANQTVIDFGLDNCTTYSTEAINFTFYDEGNSSLIYVDVSGTINYTSNGIPRTYTIDETTVDSFSVCISPSYAEFTGVYNLFYSAAIYPERRYYENTAIYNNASVGVGLYSLLATEGIYARFQVVNGFNAPIEGVQGTMKKLIGGSWTTVEQENTDGSGLDTFFVDPDTDYEFTFSKDGVGSKTVILRPTTSEIYTIVLGGSGIVINQSLGAGISYTFTPVGDLANGTSYDFRFQMSSSYWTVTGCTLSVQGDGATISSSSTSYDSNSCDITVTENSGTYSTMTSYVEYSLNNTIQVVRRDYSVKNRYVGQFSLSNFIDDLKGFAGAGFNDFTRMMIAFIVIMVIVGGLSYKAEIREPEVLIGIFIVLVWFFSYIGFFTLNYGAIPSIGVISSTVIKQYILAILVSLAGGSFILRRITQ